MAQFQSSPLPRIPTMLWLQAPERHRAFSVFNGAIDGNIKCRRCDGKLWNYIGEHGIKPEVFHHVATAGFGGVVATGFHKIDHALVTALVERWRPETHTFHLPVGEATVTLQDVQVLWGLPVDGQVVSGTWVQGDYDYWAPIVSEELGFIPTPADIKNNSIKINTLIEQIREPYPNNDLAYRQRARLIILAILGGHLFADSNSWDVSLNYLSNIHDLSVAGRCSWGSAVLAYLYRQLCNTAAKWDTKGIVGPLLLLHFWAWARIPTIPTNR